MKLKKILQSTRGELLLESVLSIMLFSMLILAVTVLITVANNILGSTSADEQAYYTQLEAVLLDAPLDASTQTEMDFSVEYHIKLKQKNGTDIVSGPYPIDLQKKLRITDKDIISLH